MGAERHLRYTQPTVPIAVVTFRFDPTVQLIGDVVVRWGTIALVLAIVAALVIAGMLARSEGLRADDVAFVSIGIVPGAVIGGRIGYVLTHPAMFGGGAGAILDPSIGSLELGLAVVGGFVTGTYVASLLGSPIGRWLQVAIVPTLFVLGAGKLAMVLTGTGQGQPDESWWSTRYVGPGPWGSLLPGLPSVPSQAVEGILTLGVLILVAVLLMVGAFRRRVGMVFFFGIGIWAVARAVVSSTWRDPVAIGRLPAAGVLAVGIASLWVIAIVALIIRARTTSADRDQRAPSDGAGKSADPESDTVRTDLAWPDPDSRPRF
jgi:phosphatidylglycerol:prolipoprotein diacylglycerol transferase